MIKSEGGTGTHVNLSSLCFGSLKYWWAEKLEDQFSTLLHLTQVSKTHEMQFQTSYWDQEIKKIDAYSLHFNDLWNSDLWRVRRVPERQKISSTKCGSMGVCLCMSLCELGPFCLGGAGNSIGLRQKEFRPPKQGHVLMFSRSFLRSQTVTFNYHSHYPTSLSSSVELACPTSLRQFAIMPGDSRLRPLTYLKEKSTQIVAKWKWTLQSRFCSLWELYVELSCHLDMQNK